MTNTTILNLKESGNKVIASLNEAKETLTNAQRWGKEDFRSVSSFLTIINGTVNDTKYRMAQAIIDNANEELEKFISLLDTKSVPVSYAKHLQTASLPKEITKHNFFEIALTDAEYDAYRAQLDDVIASVSDIISVLN